MADFTDEPFLGEPDALQVAAVIMHEQIKGIIKAVQSPSQHYSDHKELRAALDRMRKYSQAIALLRLVDLLSAKGGQSDAPHPVHSGSKDDGETDNPDTRGVPY